MDSGILVTGANGLIGACAVAMMSRMGIPVIGLDVRVGSSVLPGVEFVEGDVCDAALVGSLVARVGSVLHLAGVVGVDAYLSEPDHVLDVNILGTRAVLRACEAHAKAVVVASTSEVYGRTSFELREDSEATLGPPSAQRWCYAASKRAAEHYAFACAARGVRCAILRFFNVYGASLDPVGRERVLTRFVRAVQRAEPLAVLGDGTAVRSFCYVDDAVECALGVLERVVRGDPEVRARAFNVGRVEPVTMTELADLVVRLADHRPGVRLIEPGERYGRGFEEIPHRVPDVSAVERATGWSSRVPLVEGLRRVLSAHGLLAAAPAAPADAAIPYVRPCFDPDPALLATLHRSLASGVVSNEGPQVAAFEREVAAWLGAPRAAAVTSGTTGLMLAALALGLRGRVVMPAFTYIATQAAMSLVGIEVAFCDVTPERWTLDPDALRALLDAHPDVCAVVAVNVYGVPPDLDRIAALCRSAGARLIYDNAHGLGTARDGRRFEEAPDVVVQSLHATKVLPAGEGGLVLARDPALDREIRRLRGHGLAPKILESSPGLNARMDELRGAVGRHVLRGLDAAIARRRAYGGRLRGALARWGGLFETQRVPDGVESNEQNLAAVCRRPEFVASGELQRHFDALGVGTRRYFYPALHLLPAERGRWTLPVTDRVASGVLCLPVHSRMTEPQLARIEGAIDRAGRSLGG